MKLYVGTHTHRHGFTSYLFESETPLDMSDFIKHLGDDYESDRDDEFLDFEPITPERIRT